MKSSKADETNSDESESGDTWVSESENDHVSDTEWEGEESRCEGGAAVDTDHDQDMQGNGGRYNGRQSDIPIIRSAKGERRRRRQR